jgi:hypothetical protein
VKAAIALLIVVAISAVPFAFAQYGSTPEILQECADIGISADKCSEQAILKTRCIGCGSNRMPDNPNFEVNFHLIPIYAGIAVAFAAGVLYVRRTKDSRKPRQSH